jgi:hypothetical protein
MSMQARRYDLTGQRFGRLTATAPGPRLDCGALTWICRCDCGAETKCTTGSLRNGHSKSCGCLHSEKTTERLTKHGHSRVVSGRRSPEYTAWSGIVQRCTNPKNEKFPDYGARGIVVYDRWRRSFADFLADMGERPSRDHSVDRIDVNGNYEPSNCRWATRREQQANRRCNRMVRFNGETICLQEASRRIGFTAGKAYCRWMKYGAIGWLG